MIDNNVIKNRLFYLQQSSHILQNVNTIEKYVPIIKTQQIKHTLNSKSDFIKKFHLCTNTNVSYQLSQTEPSSIKSKSIISIYQNQFKIRISHLSTQHKLSTSNNQSQNVDNQNNFDDNQNKMQIQQLRQMNSLNNKYEFKDLYFQTVPYDAAFIPTNPYNSQNSQNSSFKNIIVSNRFMPVRIYSVNFNSNLSQSQPSSYCTFNDHKQNSQQFLSPYQFSVKNKKVVGVGRKFFNIYDCQKIQTSRLISFDKLHLSTVELLSDQNTTLVGDFLGNIYQIDLRIQNYKLKLHPFKPHQDAIFHLKSFQSNQNYFLSSARKDNFTYLFDRRNLQTFVNHYEFDRQSNQRYGISTKNNWFCIGTQNGQIYLNNINNITNTTTMNDSNNQNIQERQNEIIFKDQNKINITDINIEQQNQKHIKIIYSLGTRFYQDLYQQQQIQIKPNNHNYGLKQFTYHF